MIDLGREVGRTGIHPGGERGHHQPAAVLSRWGDAQHHQVGQRSLKIYSDRLFKRTTFAFIILAGTTPPPTFSTKSPFHDNIKYHFVLNLMVSPQL